MVPKVPSRTSEAGQLRPLQGFQLTQTSLFVSGLVIGLVLGILLGIILEANLFIIP